MTSRISCGCPQPRGDRVECERAQEAHGRRPGVLHRCACSCHDAREQTIAAFMRGDDVGEAHAC